MFKIKLKLNNRGFTLPEALISFLLISMIIVWVTQSLPGIRQSNNKENDRMVALMRNMEIMEVIRGHLNDTGEIKRLSLAELTGGSYGVDKYYSTMYERFESTTGGESSGNGNRSIKDIIASVLDTDIHPELSELVPKQGGNSELYLISLNTTVAKNKFKRSEITSFMYTNSSLGYSENQDDLVMWLSAEGKSNFDVSKENWEDSKGSISDINLVGFDYNTTSGWTGQSLLFDGINDTVNLGSSGLIKPEKFSIELYMRPENRGRRHVVLVDWGSVGGGVRSGYTVEILQDGYIAFGLNSQKAYLKTQKNINWGEYVHVVATYDGEYQKIYIDGNLEASEKNTTNYGYSLTNNTELSSKTYDLFKGNIQDVRIYKKSLTPEEVTKNYEKTAGGK